jgi:hypothetical protein
MCSWAKASRVTTASFKKLGKLETNGGAVMTHRLKSGNPAIDRGTCTQAPPDDARGFARFQGTDCDVGAFEYTPCPGAPTAPVILDPPNKAKLHGSKVTLDWAGPDCATKFSIVVRQGSKSGNIVYERPKINNTQTTPTNLSPGKYFWQVTGYNSNGSTAGSFLKFKLKP